MQFNPSMEMTVPLNAINLDNIKVGALITGRKLMTTISYESHDITMTSLSIILPFATIHSYDPVSGHLILQVTDNQYITKLNGLQDHILKLVRGNQAAWFPSYTQVGGNIRRGFQPMVEENLLHVYCPVGSGCPYDISVYKGEWGRTTRGIIQVGQPIRAIIRIQGVAFHRNNLTSDWTGKFRLQHRILAIYVPQDA